MKPFLTLLIVLLLSKVSYSQKQASIWYFGEYAGLNVSAPTAVLLTDGQLITDEGVASICNANGQLLFYTEGTKIWNAIHQVMPNGQDLLGSFSSSQSAIIVPKIGDTLRYYVFTVDQLGRPPGLNYSVVNMALDNGKGDVEIKNIPLQGYVCEKLTAVKHCNGRDIWVIVHAYNSDAFDAYLVTPSGVSTVPVVSHTGRFISNANVEYAIGCMKASPDGRKLAAAHHHLGVDLMDFDNSSGVASNGRSVFDPSDGYYIERGPYGVEFSPNSKLLYASADFLDPNGFAEKSILLQYDITLPDLPSIRASKYVVFLQGAYWSSENFGSLQNAPNGKMYMAEMGQPYISVINAPNLPGAACGFVHAGIPTDYSNGGWSKYGLPSFIQSFWKPGFTFRGACSGLLLYFDYERSSDELSVKWDFGDPASGPNNQSLSDSSQHTFTNAGPYTVKLIRYTACGNDTVTQQVNAGAGQADLGRDTLLCGVSQYTLTPVTGGTNNTYLWQNGSTGPSFTATLDGLYWVQVTNTLSGCINRDSITLSFKTIPQFDLGSDLNKCAGEIVNLSASVPGSNYLWNNNFTGNAIHVTQSGLYWLEVYNGGCKKRDSITITFNQYPVINFGKDTTLCEDQVLLLDAQNPGMQYTWQDNSTAQTFPVHVAGIYSVKINNVGCTTADTIRVDYLAKPLFSLGSDQAICDGMNIVLIPVIQKGDNPAYLWSNNATTPSITVSQSGNYTLTLSNNCGLRTDDINVIKGVCHIYVPTAFSPNNDGRNDIFKALYGENVTTFNLKVFSREGILVFQSNNIKQGWNGNYLGQPLQSNVFAWIIRYSTNTDASEKILKGTVMLVR